MSAIKVEGTLLTASVDDRTLTYRLLPYGEPGRTSIGRVVVHKGDLTIPEPSSLVANLEHDEKRPVAKFVSIEENDEGLSATVRVLATTAGNDLLTEAAEGVRTGISVEVDNPVVRAGRLVKGLLSGAGFVTKPAFATAQLVASDFGDEIDTEVTEASGEGEDPSEDADQSAESEENVSDNLTAAAPAAAPEGLHAATDNKGPKTSNDVYRLMASAYRTGGERKMTAALEDIVPGDILGVEQPQYVGELWSGRAFQRKVIPLFNHATLSSFKVNGWRWTTKPVVAAYAGNKGAVPSNEVATEQVSIDAERIAGAHDIDRKFRDFGDAEFWAAYYKAMTESYAQVSDTAVLTDVLTAAGTAVEVGTVPTGVATGMAMIVDGALEVLADANALPTFALVATDLYRDILLTRNDDTLSYLNAALGLEDGTIANFRVVPHSGVTAGHVLVGAREAVTVHELGEVPIRVEAENIANGGIDAGVFGYYAVNVHDADALVLVGPQDQG